MFKRVVSVITVLFFAGMACLTVYSRTLHQNKLPKVSLGLPHTGELIYDYTKYADAQLNDDYDDDYAYIALSQFSNNEPYGDVFPFYKGFKINLSFPGSKHTVGEGYVLDVYANENGTYAVVGFNNADITDGDSVILSFYGHTPELNNLLPLSAVHTDNGGYSYIYTVEETWGAWGKEYIVRKEVVTSGRYDAENIWVPYLSTNKPIVLYADAPIYDGCIVRFYP